MLKEIMVINDKKSTGINEINVDDNVVFDREGISDALNDHVQGLSIKNR